jgi:hypothetical protein
LTHLDWHGSIRCRDIIRCAEALTAKGAAEANETAVAGSAMTEISATFTSAGVGMMLEAVPVLADEGVLHVDACGFR